MKNKIWLFALLAFLFPICAISQNLSEIHGMVVDTNSYERIQYATIQLLDADNHFLNGAISDKDGNFYIREVAQGKYVLVVSCLGYKKKQIRLSVDAPQKSFSVKLCPDTKMLIDVTVTGEMIQRQQQIDKTVFGVDESVLEKSATALDVLRKVPGLTVKQATEEIRVHGSRNVMVLIDGSYSKRSLNSLSPEDIESVEVVTNPSAEFDSDVANVVNIVLKNERKKGLRIVAMGRASCPDNYGFARLGVDYEFSKIRVYANYMPLRMVVSPKQYLFDSSYYAVNDQFGNQFEHYSSSHFPTKGKTNSHLLQYGFESRFSEKDLLSFNGNFRTEQSKNTMIDETRYFENSNLIYNEIDTDYHQSKEPEQNYSLFYRHKFDEKGHKLSLNSNLYLMRGNYLNDFKSLFSYSDSDENDEIDMIRNVFNSQMSWNTKLKYDLPFAQRFKMTLGVQSYFRKLDYTMDDDRLQQFFRYQDLRWAGFGQLKYDVSEKLSMSVGLRAENLNFKIYDTVSRSQMNYLPNASVLYKFDGRHSLALHYNTYLAYPSYHFLSPFVYTQTDSLVFSSGNPNLLPEKAQKISLKYAYQGDVLYCEIEPYFMARKGLIGEKRVIDGPVTFGMYDNLEDARKYGGNVTLECGLGPVSLMAENDFGYAMFEHQQFNGWECRMAASVDVDLPLDLTFEAIVSYDGTNRRFNGHNYFSPMIETISLSRSFWNNRLFTELSMENFFLTEKSVSTMQGNDYYNKVWSECKNPTVNLLVRYVFKAGDRKMSEIEENESLMESEENVVKRK